LNQNSLQVYSNIKLTYTGCYPRFQKKQWVEGSSHLAMWRCMA